ncbi:MAG: peptidoglycan DD-metalloendopeptidase family protein [Candidatus Omnitrophica bacterium]|nr:peptidoglycan DD-metalloendopeptidase family protein [Candidatus Omnitrophota bacterium]
MNSKNVCFFILLVFNFMLFGCAAPREVVRVEPVSREPGIYHKVEPKETLWRIAEAYGLTVEELVRANNIPDAAHIQENQLIFIPQAGEQKSTVPSSEISKSDEFKWPIQGKIISYFGDARSSWINNGIEIKSEMSQKVFPSRSGEVVFADYLNGYGDTIIVDHADGYQTVYARTSNLLASLGDYVTSQTPIADMGADNDSLALLHFEIRKNSAPKNPLYFLP